jgi:hypothetical protein
LHKYGATWRSKAEKTLPLVWWQSDEKREERSPELAGYWLEMGEEEFWGFLQPNPA